MPELRVEVDPDVADALATETSLLGFDSEEAYLAWIVENRAAIEQGTESAELLAKYRQRLAALEARLSDAGVDPGDVDGEAVLDAVVDERTAESRGADDERSRERAAADGAERTAPSPASTSSSAASTPPSADASASASGPSSSEATDSSTDAAQTTFSADDLVRGPSSDGSADSDAASSSADSDAASSSPGSVRDPEVDDATAEADEEPLAADDAGPDADGETLATNDATPEAGESPATDGADAASRSAGDDAAPTATASDGGTAAAADVTSMHLRPERVRRINEDPVARDAGELQSVEVDRVDEFSRRAVAKTRERLDRDVETGLEYDSSATISEDVRPGEDLADLDAIDVPGRSADLVAERRAVVGRALALLRDEGRARRSEFVEALYGEHAAGYETADGWWRCVREGISQVDAVDGGHVWTYED